MKFGMCVAAILGMAALPAAAQDWAGGYAGVQVGVETGTTQPAGGPEFSSDDTAPAVVLGYNWQMANNLVLGSELVLASGSVTSVAGVPFEANAVSQLRGRVGYDMGKAMPYLALGAGMTDFGLLGAPQSSETGLSVGLGLEFMVADKLSARMEYTRTDFGGVWDDFAPGIYSYETETLSLGVMYHF